MRTVMPLVLVALTVGSCSAGPPESADHTAGASVGGRAGYPEVRPASSEPLPHRFGFGRAARANEIATLDIDVKPDGTGLPPGSGTPAEGAPVYATRCVTCHGANGEVVVMGNRLVGRNPDDAFDFASDASMELEKTIGNYWPYATTVFDYIRRAMPFDQPGSLTDDEVYALTAYLLHLNGIIAADAVIDATTLPQIPMPARDRFVPDDRLTSTRVR